LATRLVAIGLSVAGCLLADRALAAETAAQGILAPRAPEIAAGQDDLKARSSMLEREQRWSDVVAACETAARKGTLSPELQ